MKIAVIPTIRSHPWGAPGHCMGELVRELLEARHEVLWFVAPIDLDHRDVRHLRALGARIAVLPEPDASYVRFPRIRKNLDRLFAGAKPISTLLDHFRPDHVYVNQGGTWDSLHPQLFAPLVSRPGRYSLICHLNRFDPPRPPAGLTRARQLFSSASKVFFPSRWTHEIAKAQIASPIPNAGYFQYPHRFHFEQPLPWPEAPQPRLAVVCRLDSFHKGLDLAFEALAAIRGAAPRFHVGIFGSGPDESYLRDLATHLSVADALTFHGFANSVEAVWREYEILLLPSRYEGCAVALTEALGFGRPVIATAVGGAPEWVTDSVNGFLCASPHSGLLGETLLRAIHDRHRWREMGLAAHRAFTARRQPRPARTFLQALPS